MSAKLTEADAKSWHMCEAIHYNGGAAFFAYLHRCVEQPRLSRYDRYDRKTRSVKSTWRADGQDHESFADAIEALNTPPEFTADELAFLADAPQDYEAEKRRGIDYALAMRIVDKGGIEFERGRYRITDAGRLAKEENSRG